MGRVFVCLCVQVAFLTLCERVCVCERERKYACALASTVQLPNLTELKPTLACQAKGTKTHTQTHTHTGRLSLSLTLFFQLCIFQTLLSQTLSVSSFLSLSPHTHRHTCSPRPAKRERWLVNKQWHSAHSVTRLGFDQHRCSCSPQQCFLSFCPLNVAHTHTHTRAQIHTL